MLWLWNFFSDINNLPFYFMNTVDFPFSFDFVVNSIMKKLSFPFLDYIIFKTLQSCTSLQTGPIFIVEFELN